MTDEIQIRDLLIRGVLGVNDWEREQPQDILVNLTLLADLRRVGATDDIADTVNYRTVAKKVIAHVETARRFTVEALAADIARICLAEPGVERVRVRVEKPGALRFARSVGVEIERSAGDMA
jgi:FolB domain-containing protein